MPSFPDQHESEVELSPAPRPTGKRALFGCAAIALLLLGLLIFSGFWAAKEVRRSMRGTAAFQQGEALVQEERFTAARSAFTTALENRLTTSQRALALGDRGWSLTKLDRDPEAIRDFSAALEIDPNLGFARLDRGLAYHRQGKYDEALADYDRAIAADPNLVDAYRNRALIFAQRGRLPAAIADMKEAVRCAPDDPRWFVRLGEMTARAGELEVARASYESALRLSPEDEEANYGEATLLAQEKQPERGLAMINEAIGLHPDSASLYFARGRVELDRDLPADAAQDFGEAIRLRPDFAMAYSNRGLAEVGLRRTADALSDSAQALRLDASLSWPYYVRGRAFVIERQYAEAIKSFDRALARAPDFLWARMWRAIAESYAGHGEKARAELEEAIQKFPGAAATHLTFAWFLATCPEPSYRDGSGALREAQRALTLDGRTTGALDVLGAAYAEAGDFTRAIDSEREILAQLPAGHPARARYEQRLRLFQEKQAYRDVAP